jgi:hypothetical protein
MITVPVDYQVNAVLIVDYARIKPLALALNNRYGQMA